MKVSVCTLKAREWDVRDMFRRLSQQSFKDFEWVIVDFLYDKTKEYFKELSAQYKVHIKHISNVRDSFPYMRDISRNRNEALVHADGDTIISKSRLGQKCRRKVRKAINEYANADT